MNSRTLDKQTLLSVIIPVFNEEEVLPRLFGVVDKVIASLPVRVEVVLVNDGSRDGSLERMLEKKAGDSHYRVIDLARNFGHQQAVSAGLSLARGDVVAILDADLQDPPELLGPMLDRWHHGVDVVYGQRGKREGESAFKRATAYVFYRLLNWAASAEIPPDTGDFRLMDRKVVDALNAMPERQRFLRGMIAWLGYRQEPILYDRQARQAGITKYPLKKMVALSMDALFSFSMKPLRWMALAGVGMTLIGVLLVAVLVVVRLRYPHIFVPGLATTWVALLVLFGFNFLCLGILGEYVGRTFVNVQGRPGFLIREVYAQAEPDSEHPGGFPEGRAS
ncbi:MAG: glycosyltransferase family 2 protein [Candidatus Nitricoxidivorans perseverans]|uniref:Glycosyltransferase family 2 protein n=1 Tax=Candidatus Nitricoxidivorans perseverans TaxID=2975601 RepID=A0AA49FJR4_9PROT|nr:MAG: glycosyltransferase family 2 protein [Candidatus Nitricoxidivorans perseverans]